MAELERFKDLKASDFKDSMKAVLNELIEAQKKVRSTNLDEVVVEVLLHLETRLNPWLPVA